MRHKKVGKLKEGRRVSDIDDDIDNIFEELWKAESNEIFIKSISPSESEGMIELKPSQDPQSTNRQQLVFSKRSNK